MSKPIQIYLSWEIKLNLDYLHQPISKFAVNTDAYNMAIQNQLPITVNQFRRDSGLPPHPDERGEFLVWQEDVTKPGDDVIKRDMLLTARAELEKNNKGALQRGELQLKYPELYAATSD